MRCAYSNGFISLGSIRNSLPFLALSHHNTQPGSDIDEVADTVKDEMLEGPRGQAFNRELSMSYFLSNSVRVLFLGGAPFFY